MVTSTPPGLLARSKREHPFHLSGIHTQQSLTNWHFISWPIWSPYQAILVPQHNCGEPPHTHSLRSSSLLDTQSFLHPRSLFTRAQAPQSSEYNKPTEQLHSSYLYVEGAAYSSTSSANQLLILCLCYFGISASHTPPLLKFNY